MKSNIYRQGDVLIECVEQVPSTAKREKGSRRIVLALGEATGHHHALETQERDPADWWKEESAQVVGGVQYVRVKKAAKVTHQEHATIDLPAGTYRVTRQREYSPEAIRNVAD